MDAPSETSPDAQPIVFNGKKPEWGMLSNYSLHGFKYNDKLFPSVEHYLQADKFRDHELCVEEIRWTFMISDLHDIVEKLETDHPYSYEAWKERRIAAAERAISAKFDQNPHLKRILKSTGTRKLIDKTYKKDNDMNEITSAILTELRSNLLSEHI